MNMLTRLLAWRYLMRSSDTNAISTMIFICFLTLFIGSFALTLVSAIMNGFEHTMYEKMQGIHAHIIMRGHGDQLNIPALQQALAQQFPEVIASCPSTTEHVLVQTAHTAPTVALIKAIDPAQEIQVTNFNATLTDIDIDINIDIDIDIDNVSKTSSINTHINCLKNKPVKNIASLLHHNRVALGTELATLLGVSVGDEIELLHTDNQTTQGRAVTFDTTTAYVSALFKTGIDEWDSALIITSFDFLMNLFPDSGPTQLNLKINIPSIGANSTEKHLIQRLTDYFKLDVFSWKDLYPAIVSALTLEKYAMVLILILIMLVASMNSISLLFMYIAHKQTDIALLKALGTNNTTIEYIFMAIGIGITITATIPGIALAALVSTLLNYYRLIALPDAYYISYLPAYLEKHMIILLFTGIVTISFIAIKIALRKTNIRSTAHLLRFGK